MNVRLFGQLSRCQKSLVTIIGSATVRTRFSTTTKCAAKKPARSPTARRMERQLQQGVIPPKSKGSLYNWPKALLDEAYKDGQIPIDSNAAVALLDQFVKLQESKNITEASIAQLCNEHKIHAYTLMKLVSPLANCGDQNIAKLSLPLINATRTQMLVPEATIDIVHQYIKSGNLHSSAPQLVSALSELHRLSDANMPSAMILQAEVLAKTGKKQASLLLLEKLLALRNHAAPGSNVFEDYMGNFYVFLGELKYEMGDKDGGKVAYENALQYDEPQAYFFLADRYKTPSDPDYLTYMLKAAATGSPTSAYKVGMFYFNEAQDLSDSLPTSSTVVQARLKLAREWLLLAAEYPTRDFIYDCRLSLAIVLRERGQYEEGLAWLKKAAESDKWDDKTVSWLRQEWHNPDLSFIKRDLSATSSDRNRAKDAGAR